MLLNPKTVSEIEILTTMFDSKHQYFESRFFCSNDTGIARVSRMLYRASRRGLVSQHKFANHRYLFYKLTDKGYAMAMIEKKKETRKDNELRTRIITFITNNECSTSKEISRGIKKAFNDVIETLRELSLEKVIYMEKDDKDIFWYIK